MFLVLVMFSFLSCGQNNRNTLSKSIDENKLDETSANESEVIKGEETKLPQTYGIEGEEIFLRKGPGDKFERIINEKASSVSTVTQYLQLDYSVKINILESDGIWTKIKVVEPEWLSDTHIGWIPTKFIIKNNSYNEDMLENLDFKDYEIIKTGHNSNIHNFHVLIKQKEFNKETVFEFIKKFRKEHCTSNCNVFVYDSKSISQLIDKYPLEGSDYINLADHFVSMSTFDAIELKSWYPYQDFQYKEYGGKNWKKEPIN